MTDTEQNRIKAICEMAHIDDIVDLSDGYHTFRQLYYQRMILFAALVKQNRDKAWKSLRHEDGELCFGGGWFIVGIDTPKGSYTYHYEDNYFSLFECKELEKGRKWDGHTEEDVTRLLSLAHEPCSDCISRKVATDRFDLVQSDDKCMGYNDIMKFLLSLPSVEPERKMGKWINVDGSTNKADCSCCGNRGRAWMNYCYMCGIRMEVQDDKESTD